MGVVGCAPKDLLATPLAFVLDSRIRSHGSTQTHPGRLHQNLPTGIQA